MRKLLFLALLATASTPALAQRDRGNDGGQRGPRVERSQGEAPRPDRGNWQQRGDGGQAAQNWRGGSGGDQGMARFRQAPPQQPMVREAPNAVAPEAYRQRDAQARSGWSRQVPNTNVGSPTSAYRQGRDGYRNPIVRDQRNVGSYGYPQQQQRFGSTPYYGSSRQSWSNNWRQNPRYDWRDYRNQNRNVFRLGTFYDPFGYGYRPLSVGFTLYSGYYQPNYWLNDPFQYRLPPVYGPYRWIRYWDDAVLVDIYTGEVVDVIRGFFW